MRTRSSWLVVMGFAVSLPSCLFLEDFDSLQRGGAASGGEGGEAASSIASTASTSASTSSEEASSSAGGETASSSSSSSAGGDGAGGTGGASSAGGGGGAGGDGPGPLASHGFVYIIRSNNEACSVEITDLVIFGDDLIVAGVTTANGFVEDGCITQTQQQTLDLQAFDGESASWVVRISDADPDQIDLTVVDTVSEVDIVPTRLAVAGGRLFVGFDGGVDSGTGKRVLTVRDITSPPPIGEEYVDYQLLASGEVTLTDLFGAAGQVYATGIIDGDSEAGAACTGGASGGTYDHAGFVWSIADSTCELGTFGDETAVWSGIASNPVTLAAGGNPDFGGASPCDDEYGDATLSVLDVEAVDAVSLPGNCLRPTLLGQGAQPFPFMPLGLAANNASQIIGVRSAAGPSLRRRVLPAGTDGGETSFTGNPEHIVPFATPRGTIGAVGRFTGPLGYGDLDVASTDGRAGFFVTFDGDGATSFVLDAASAGGPFNDTFTAALGSSEGLWIAGQWQEGFRDELGFDETLLNDFDPPGTAAFLTLLPDL